MPKHGGELLFFAPDAPRLTECDAGLMRVMARFKAVSSSAVLQRTAPVFLSLPSSLSQAGYSAKAKSSLSSGHFSTRFGEGGFAVC